MHTIGSDARALKKKYSDPNTIASHTCTAATWAMQPGDVVFKTPLTLDSTNNIKINDHIRFSGGAFFSVDANPSNAPF